MNILFWWNQIIYLDYIKNMLKKDKKRQNKIYKCAKNRIK